MVDYVAYNHNMHQHHDFELYATDQDQHHHQQHQQHFLSMDQSYLPSSTFSMEQSFIAPFDQMLPLADAPQPDHLQFNYDLMTHQPKPYHYQTPTASPHPSLISFQDHAPILSASSESGASVSSSSMSSPPLDSHFNTSWDSVGLGLTSSFEYPATVAADKSFVGEFAPFLALDRSNPEKTQQKDGNKEEQNRTKKAKRSSKDNKRSINMTDQFLRPQPGPAIRFCASEPIPRTPHNTIPLLPCHRTAPFSGPLQHVITESARRAHSRQAR
jgi:hypothetical protein